MQLREPSGGPRGWPAAAVPGINRSPSERHPPRSSSGSAPAALEARGSRQALAGPPDNTRPEQTLRRGAGNHLRQALWTGPRWKLGSALHPLLARRLLTHSLRTIINTRGGRGVFAQRSQQRRRSHHRTNRVCSVSAASLKMPFGWFLGCDAPRRSGVPGRWHGHGPDRHHRAVIPALSSGLSEACFGGGTPEQMPTLAREAGRVWTEKVG